MPLTPDQQKIYDECLKLFRRYLDLERVEPGQECDEGSLPICPAGNAKPGQVCEGGTLPICILKIFKLGREYDYDSLPNCIIDAVFSIGVRYESTRKTVRHYCDVKGTRCYSNPPGHPSDAHKVDDLLANIAASNITSDDFGATDLFNNRQRTSTRNGILKAEAVCRFAKVLATNGIQTIADIRSASSKTISAIEKEIMMIPGQRSGISFSYFLMLSGDDNHMKIDRWLLRFVGEALGIPHFNGVANAEADLRAVCDEMQKIYPCLTPRLLDYIIWSYMKSRSTKVSSTKTSNTKASSTKTKGI